MSPIILLCLLVVLSESEHKNYLPHYTVLKLRNQILLPSLTPSTGPYKCQLAELLIDKNSAEKKKNTKPLSFWLRKKWRQKDSSLVLPTVIKGFLSL